LLALRLLLPLVPQNEVSMTFSRWEKETSLFTLSSSNSQVVHCLNHIDLAHEKQIILTSTDRFDPRRSFVFLEIPAI
jgi:hypothetical protein